MLLPPPTTHHKNRAGPTKTFFPSSPPSPPLRTPQSPPTLATFQPSNPHTTTATVAMAKGLRASVKKNNRTKLRSSVFGPVEAARAERLHAKLLETISQPKPEAKKADTDVDSADSTKGEAQLPKGSCFLSAKIPRSLSHQPTSTSTNTLDPKSLAQDNFDSRNLFFYLGLSSDIVGFTEEGNLKCAFDALPRHWLSDNGLTAT
jgi:hypothetical protein